MPGDWNSDQGTVARRHYLRVSDLKNYDISYSTVVVYRTNNLSTLEEKNVQLFLDCVDENLKIKQIFGEKKEQIFGKFSDFHLVLSALSQISKKLERKIGVAKFDTKQRKSVTSEEGKEAFKSIYDEEPESNYEGELYGGIYDTTQDRKEGTDLDQAINEMINFNETFITKVLEHIRTNFESKAVPPLLGESSFQSSKQRNFSISI